MTGLVPSDSADVSFQPPKRGSITADLISGLANGIANIPDAMANALLAGASPIVGLYALLAGTPVAALTTSSQFMTVAITSAMAVTLGSGLATIPREQHDAAVALVALAVGAFMVAFGLLKGGRLLRFVSNAVMKGFLNGVALIVVVGQLPNITGYSSSWQTKLAKAIDTAVHVFSWNPMAMAVGAATIAIILVLMRTRLRAYAMLIALAVVSGGVYLLHIDVALVKSVSAIPSGLPMPRLPELRLLPELIVPAVAVALIGLVQGGGISKSYPNADGTFPNASRDMVGQGLANAAASVFGGMPMGASASSTAMAVSGGARTRLSNFVIGVVVAAVLLLLGPLVELVPLSVLAGILIVVGVTAFDTEGMLDVWRTSRESAAIMGITLGSMLLVPVQYAVLLGAALSAVQYVYSSSKDVKVVSLVQLPDGRWQEHDPPQILPSREVLVVDIYGSFFYAGVDLVDKLLPSVGAAERPFLVVRVRGHSEVGSTFLTMIRRYHGQIEAAGGRLVLAGTHPRLLEQLRNTGILDELGEENVLPVTSVVFDSTAAAVEMGNAWLEGRDTQSNP
ncbi:MAG: SulP family inorganic anion transporter [Coriobacteriia bacterium]|nr:SulP family inorganic anion transporter [Coriobacteriia bacterium]